MTETQDLIKKDEDEKKTEIITTPGEPSEKPKENEGKDEETDPLKTDSNIGSGGTSTVTEQDLGFCKSNQDCEKSTFCCSDFSCIDPSICLHGKK